MGDPFINALMQTSGFANEQFQLLLLLLILLNFPVQLKKSMLEQSLDLFVQRLSRNGIRREPFTDWHHLVLLKGSANALTEISKYQIILALAKFVVRL